MAGPKISEAAQYILDTFRDMNADEEFTKEQAAMFWGGTKAVKVADTTDVQLMQYCLLQLNSELRLLYARIDELSKEQPNRAARRAAKSK